MLSGWLTSVIGCSSKRAEYPKLRNGLLDTEVLHGRVNTAFVMTSLLTNEFSSWTSFRFIKALVGLARGSLGKFVSNGFEQVWFGQ